jgi:hypothetical protein
MNYAIIAISSLSLVSQSQQQVLQQDNNQPMYKQPPIIDGSASFMIHLLLAPQNCQVFYFLED